MRPVRQGGGVWSCFDMSIYLDEAGLGKAAFFNDGGRQDPFATVAQAHHPPRTLP